MMDKYLNPKKGQKSKGQNKGPSKLLDMDTVRYETIDTMKNKESSEDEEDMNSEDMPVFVETAESRAMGEEEKQRALAGLTKPRAQPRVEEKVSSGRWVESEGQQGALGKRLLEEEASDSSDGESSEDRPRKRHDMYDSDIEIDSEEMNMQQQEKEEAFKSALVQALGIDPSEAGGEKEAEEEAKGEEDDLMLKVESV